MVTLFCVDVIEKNEWICAEIVVTLIDGTNDYMHSCTEFTVNIPSTKNKKLATESYRIRIIGQFFPIVSIAISL